MRGWSGQQRKGGLCGQSRMWSSGGGKIFIAWGESRPDWAATEMLSAAWLPPKDLASFTPEHPSAVSPFPPLSPSLPSLLLLFHYPFTPQFLLLHFFFLLHSSYFLHTPPKIKNKKTPQRLGHYKHSGGLRGGGSKGEMWRLRRHKRLEIQRPAESGWLWKETGRLLNADIGRTHLDRQSELSPFSSSFRWCLFCPPHTQRKAQLLQCAFPRTPDILSNTLRHDGGIAGGGDKEGDPPEGRRGWKWKLFQSWRGAACTRTYTCTPLFLKNIKDWAMLIFTKNTS